MTLVSILIVLLVLSGPLAYFFGTDSRPVDDRQGGWFGSRRSR
jgi:hypothetical protein